MKKYFSVHLEAPNMAIVIDTYEANLSNQNTSKNFYTTSFSTWRQVGSNLHILLMKT